MVIISMNSKIMSDLIGQFHRVASQYAQLEAQPVTVDDEHVLSTREIHTIDAIGCSQLNTVSDVGRFFGITKSAASQLISKLEKRGFLSKNCSSKNNKEVQLVLTDLGWKAYQLHEQLHGKERTALFEQFEQLPPEQLLHCNEVMALFSKVLVQRLKKG